MVAVIKTGHSIHRILSYNENKVKAGVAECIGAGNYPIDPDKMSLKIKLNRFLRQLELNTNVKRNSVHISLNFDPSESRFPQEKLLEIAEDYMGRIGFGEQPYLVYQHNDAGHPHIHIASIKVRADGSRIDMNNIGRNQSETARKAIEKEHGLIAAEKQKKVESYQLKPVSVSRALYGKSETKAAIQNVMEAVLNSYKFASLPELNAVLKQYNVACERGTKESKLFKTGGLLYRVLDTAGSPVGVPIKASLFYNKPTLKFLEQKFVSNEQMRLPYKARIKNAIDLALLKRKLSIPDLTKQLEKQGINTALRINENGILYGITYVDHQTKCVFNGSVLGKPYSAKAIQERCASEQDLLTHPAQKIGGLQPPASASPAVTKDGLNDLQNAGDFKGTESLFDVLMQPEWAPNYVPGQLKKKRRKKKRKGLNSNG